MIRRAARLLFIDETGINISMTRSYARAPAGMRAVDAVPKDWGDSITVTAALTLDGIVAPMMLYGAMNARAFEAYVEQCLVPELRSDDVVVLDRLNAHKTDRVRELIEAAGVHVVFLPAYSPDFNPIEHAWSKLKAFEKRAHGPCASWPAPCAGHCCRSRAATLMAGLHTAGFVFHVSESRFRFQVGRPVHHTRFMLGFAILS